MFAKTLFNGLFENGDVVNLDDLGEEFGDAYLTAYESLSGLYNKKKNRQITVKSQVFTVLGMVLIGLASVLSAAFAAEYNQDGSVLSFVGVLVPAVFSVIFTIVLMVMDNKKYTMRKVGRFIGGSLVWIINVVVVALGGFFLSGALDNPAVGVLFIFCIPAAQFFIINMTQRTPQSVELMGKILGLKNFIEAAELDRINALAEENPSYYYDVLPYAFVMGLTDKWAKNFENIRIVTPVWYNSYDMNDRMFNAWMFSRIMNNFGTAVSNNVQIPIGTVDGGDFGGGGFGVGGGGFSGGGFGGGGGGSW